MTTQAKTIAIANQKGGVGKTTTTVNLAVGLANLGKKVLLIDMDPQGNATMGCGVDSRNLSHSACELLLAECTPQEAICAGAGGRIDLIGANTDLTAAELALMQADDPQHALKKQIQPITAGYDYILIDCPPSLSILTVNALVAANSVMIPMQCEYYALEGLTSLLDTIERIQESVNPELEIEGLLRTMYDSRNNLSNEVSQQIIEHFKSKVFMTVIPRNIRVAEAPSFGQSAIEYDALSKGAMAYKGLAGELVKRNH